MDLCKSPTTPLHGLWAKTVELVSAKWSAKVAKGRMNLHPVTSFPMRTIGSISGGKKSWLYSSVCLRDVLVVACSWRVEKWQLAYSSVLFSKRNFLQSCSKSNRWCFINWLKHIEVNFLWYSAENVSTHLMSESVYFKIPRSTLWK